MNSSNDFLFYNLLFIHIILYRSPFKLACVADKTKPRYSPSANPTESATKSLFRPPRVPVFSIIVSNWLLHMAVLSCTVIGCDWPLIKYQIHVINMVAITELAFEAVKSSLNYLTISLSNGNLWNFWGGATMSLLISLSVLKNLTSFDACRLSQILFILNQNMHTWQVPKI